MFAFLFLRFFKLPKFAVGEKQKAFAGESDHSKNPAFVMPGRGDHDRRIRFDFHLGLPPYGRVRIIGPSDVIAIVCSKCAESFPSIVTTVQPFDWVFT